MYLHLSTVVLTDFGAFDEKITRIQVNLYSSLNSTSFIFFPAYNNTIFSKASWNGFYLDFTTYKYQSLSEKYCSNFSKGLKYHEFESNFIAVKNDF